MHYTVRHPLVQHKLTQLRDKTTGYRQFRELVSEVTRLIAFEAMKNLDLKDQPIETPLTDFVGKKIANEIVIVPVLRAGIGMLEGILSLEPEARVGFVGIYRDHDSKQPVTYFEKLPENLKKPKVYVIDPMLATGGSLESTVDILKQKGFYDITVVVIIAAPEGIEAFNRIHPDVPVYTGGIDSHLDENKYIVPGLGDAGDRLFGTR